MNPFSQEILKEYDKLISSISHSSRKLKMISDLIAYQIGWGKCVIRWYEAGLKGKMPVMPGDGFSTWDYKGIAQHFHQKYRYKNTDQQDKAFHKVVLRITDIVEKEAQRGNLDRLGVWPWCTLASGKQWPLSKWIRINTCAPYKRAHALIRKTLKNRIIRSSISNKTADSPTHKNAQNYRRKKLKS